MTSLIILVFTGDEGIAHGFIYPGVMEPDNVETVEVEYDPKNPKNCRLVSLPDPIPVKLVGILVGVGLFGAGLFFGGEIR